MTRRTYLFVAAGLALALTACSSSGSQGGSGSQKGHKLAYIQLQSAPVTFEIQQGMKAATGEDGSTVTTQGPSTVNPPEAIAALSSDVSAGYDGVITTAYPSDLWVRPLANAQAAGIALASVDAGSPNSAATFHVGPSIQGKGVLLAQAIAAELGPNAEGYIQPGICVPGLDVLLPTFAGFKTEMAKLQPNVTVRDPFNVTPQPDTNYSAWDRLISQNTDALAFFGACDQDAPNLIKIKQTNPSSKYLIASASGDSIATVQAVADGTMTAVIGLNGFVMGYLSAKYMLRQLNTEEPMPDGWVNSGLDNVTQDRAAEALAVRETATPAAYQSYYAEAIAAAEALIAEGNLPPIEASLTTPTP